MIGPNMTAKTGDGVNPAPYNVAVQDNARAANGPERNGR